MSSAQPASVLITGASGAIGSALALHYARPGCQLYLHGRDTSRLAQVATACEARGATVACHQLDLRDQVALRAWLLAVEQQGLPELIIANAGLNCHVAADGSGERWEEVEALLEVNIRAVMVMVDQLLPGLRQRGHGQLALVSSLAAWHGLPATPSYCASKAAIKAYAEALRGGLADQGIRVNLIMPGYVDSTMCHAMPGPKPIVWPADRAARFIARGLAKDRARITFPYPLNHATWWLAMLPPSLSQWLIRLFGYRD